MQITKLKNKLSLILCIVLIAAMALLTTACSDNKEESKEKPEVTASQNNSNAGDTSSTQAPNNETPADKDNTLGEGETEFFFTVVDGDGNETKFTIHTDKKTVGEALLELDLISGEEGDYGLYVKEVNNITADYDVDQTYWAFYVDGEYATAGVDKTDIVAGTTYSFKVEK